MKLPWPLLLLTFSLLNNLQIYAMNGDFTNVSDLNNENSMTDEELDKQLVEQGHVEPMISFIQKQLELSGFLDEDAQITSSLQKEENFQNALRLYACYYIRATQDAFCYGDYEIHSAIKKSLKDHSFFALLNKAITNEALSKLVLEQLERVELKTKQNELPPPTWITDYYRDVLHGDPQLLPESEWQKKRLGALARIKKESESHL
jgi:hypothetical protein